MNKIVDFMREDDATIKGSTGIVDDGLDEAQRTHAATIKAKYDAIKKAENDKVEAAK